MLFVGGDTTKPASKDFPGPRPLEPFEKWTWNGIDFTRQTTDNFNFTNELGKDYWEPFVVRNEFSIVVCCIENLSFRKFSKTYFSPNHYGDECFGPL